MLDDRTEAGNILADGLDALALRCGAEGRLWPAGVGGVLAGNLLALTLALREEVLTTHDRRRVEMLTDLLVASAGQVMEVAAMFGCGRAREAAVANSHEALRVVRRAAAAEVRNGRA